MIEREGQREGGGEGGGEGPAENQMLGHFPFSPLCTPQT